MNLLLFEPGFPDMAHTRIHLEQSGYSVTQVNSLLEAKELLKQRSFQLVLFSVLQQATALIGYFRQNHPTTGIVMINSRNMTEERFSALEMGVDECLSVPFDYRELILRLRRLLERQFTIQDRALQGNPTFIGFQANTAMRQLIWLRTGERVPLTEREYDLLIYLLKNANQVVQRSTLFMRICGRSWEATDRCIDVSISNLRRKLRHYHQADSLIRSVRGKGYVLLLRRQSDFV